MKVFTQINGDIRVGDSIIPFDVYIEACKNFIKTNTMNNQGLVMLDVEVISWEDKIAKITYDAPESLIAQTNLGKDVISNEDRKAWVNTKG